MNEPSVDMTGQPSPGEQPTPEDRPRLSYRVRGGPSGGRWWTRYAVVFIAIIMAVIFSVTNPSTFPTIANFQIVLGSNSVTLLLALASLPPLIAGDFDLSVGFNLEVSAVLVAVLTGEHHLAVGLAIVITLLFGTAVGLINGLLITRVGISSFIATIGVGSILSGISLYLTNGNVLIQGIPQSLESFAQNNAAGVPDIVWMSAVIAVIFWVTFEHTAYGRRTLAIGLSPRSAQLLGMPVVRIRTSAFVISGFMSALAGVIELGYVGSASSGVGPSFLLPAVAAGFLGATTIKVGRFNVVGTVIAVILVAIGVSGLELNGVPNWVEPIFDGAVLVIAVGSSRLIARRADMT
jgi:ribose transport system permease protein